MGEILKSILVKGGCKDEDEDFHGECQREINPFLLFFIHVLSPWRKFLQILFLVLYLLSRYLFGEKGKPLQHLFGSIDTTIQEQGTGKRFHTLRKNTA